MQVQLETLGNLERRLDIALPLTDIDAEVQKRLARVARTPLGWVFGFLIGFSLLTLAFLCWRRRQLFDHLWGGRVTFTLLVGGILGNLITSVATIALLAK